MPTLHQRLRSLENRITQQPARTIVISGGHEMAKTETDVFLAQSGIVAMDYDTLVHFRTVYETKEGGVLPPRPLQILGVYPGR